MKIGDIIKIKFEKREEKYKVKVLKILEMFPNGNGFIRVKFPTGQERNISINRGGKE